MLYSAKPADAGQLFPPDNAKTAASCPSGQVLTWYNSSVICTAIVPDYSTINKNINISYCNSGQVMVGVSNGNPVCNYPLYQYATSCPGGQVMTGIYSSGQPICTTATSISGFSSARTSLYVLEIAYPSGAVRGCVLANPATGGCGCQANTSDRGSIVGQGYANKAWDRYWVLHLCY